MLTGLRRAPDGSAFFPLCCTLVMQLRKVYSVTRALVSFYILHDVVSALAHDGHRQRLSLCQVV